MNSIIHGFEHVDGGVIEIRISCINGEIQLEYRDNGSGIPKQYQKRIFDPFFTTKRNTGGSGLGMHLVFNLVTQQLGGQIKYTGSPQAGAAFLVSFPVTSKTVESELASGFAS